MNPMLSSSGGQPGVALSGATATPPSREQVLAWMRQLGLAAPAANPTLERQVLSLAERLTGRSYLTASERASLAGTPAPTMAARAASPTPGPGARVLWDSSEGELAATSFVRRMAASAEGRRRRAETLYRINFLDRVVAEEGFSVSAEEVKEMRRLSHRHLPSMFAVHLLHTVAHRDDAAGLAARVEIAKTILREGLLEPVRRDCFLVSYGFGSRDFDALFEMGDGHAVRAALVQAASTDAQLKANLAPMGWPELHDGDTPASAPRPRARG